MIAPLHHDSHESTAADLSEILDTLLDETGRKWEDIAHENRVDVSLLSKWTSNKHPMPAWRLIRFTRTVGPGLLTWIANQAGYELRPLNEKAPARTGA